MWPGATARLRSLRFPRFITFEMPRGPWSSPMILPTMALLHRMSQGPQWVRFQGGKVAARIQVHCPTVQSGFSGIPPVPLSSPTTPPTRPCPQPRRRPRPRPLKGQAALWSLRINLLPLLLRARERGRLEVSNPRRLGVSPLRGRSGPMGRRTQVEGDKAPPG